ncbi:hypothetical protein EB118_04145 [bacterium]|nr:hypothetical protein [bacterium]
MDKQLLTFQDYANTYRAMFRWMHDNFEGDRMGLAQYILECIAAGEPDCVFFELLVLTGDKAYNGTSILKVADAILNTVPIEREKA